MGHVMRWNGHRRSRTARRASVLRVLQISIAGAVLASVMGVPMATARNYRSTRISLRHRSTWMRRTAASPCTSTCGWQAVRHVEHHLDGATVLHITGSLKYTVTSPTRSIDLNSSGLPT